MDFFDLLFQYKDAYLRGTYGTLVLTINAWVIGIACGTALGGFIFTHQGIIKKISDALMYVIFSVPVLVILFWLHYPIQAIMGVSIDPFLTSLLTLSLINIMAVSNIVYNGLFQVSPNYMHVAILCGISQKTAIYKIYIPLVYRASIPSIINQQVLILQMTLFASLISYEELFKVSQQINAVVYNPIQVYSILAVIFLVLCLPLSILSKTLEIKFNQR